jgi:hypothetical protein
MAEPRRYPDSFGPYLRYAIETDFKNFEFFEERIFRLFLLAEFKSVDAADEFHDEMNKHGFAVEFGPGNLAARFIAVRAAKAAVIDPRTLGIWDQHVCRVELSLPLKPTGHAVTDERRIEPHQRWLDDNEPAAQIVIGVIDDGCPFAAAQFLKDAAGVVSTRVRGIWDQDRRMQPVEVTDSNNLPCVFGKLLSDFNYGLEFWRSSDAPGTSSPRQIGLREWIALHSTPASSVDEDGCYADAGFRTLRFARSHGAHVLDVCAGRVPTSSRIGPPTDRRDPPSFAVGTDTASSADLVFVQFPEFGVRDATGVWLKTYVVDGINYILSFADPQKTEKVVVNVSYGPTIGPHDGTAELEDALTELVTIYNGSTEKPKLEIVLPVGNSFLTEGHIAFERKSVANPDHIQWTWRLPPDNTVLCFAEIWMDKDQTDVVVTLTSPGGYVFSSDGAPAPPHPGDPIPPYTGVYAPLVIGDDMMWFLAVEPTIIGPDIVPEHGAWTIRVEHIGVGAAVHAYVARSDPNMGVYTGARRSCFVDPAWQGTRSAEAGCKYENGRFDRAGSLVERYGTLNGIATADNDSVHVAGGFILSNGRKSPYASAGRARGGTRIGPDFALPCDESYALAGIRAGGNRSGGVFRLIGTSVAAPQLARYVANAVNPVPFDMSNPEEETGAGDVPPP